MAHRSRYFTGVLLVIVPLLAGCGLRSAAPSGAGQAAQAAADYCTQNGGVVETRYPYYGTNGANPLQLSGSLQVCTFTSQADRSKIIVALDTLYTDQPTLAATAYRAKPPMASSNISGNPSSLYCTQLGGTDLFGGVTAAGGGWTREGGADVIAMCVFPDLSSIDSWGLTYHSDGTIRGKDLTGLFRYQGKAP